MPLRELARWAEITEGLSLRGQPGETPGSAVAYPTPRAALGDLDDRRLRAFYAAAHLDELPAAKRALAHVDSPTAALDTESLCKVLEAVIAAVRATTAAHVELAQDAGRAGRNTAIASRAHATALTRAPGPGRRANPHHPSQARTALRA